jgi:phosphatidylglycerophosphate synthase
MGLLDAAGDAGKGAAQNDSASDSTSRILAIVVIGALAVIVICLLVSAMSEATAVECVGAVIGLVILFAVLKLFTIADTLKQILEELRKRS